jgi:hypothetical protein
MECKVACKGGPRRRPAHVTTAPRPSDLDGHITHHLNCFSLSHDVNIVFCNSVASGFDLIE